MQHNLYTAQVAWDTESLSQATAAGNGPICV